MKPPSLKKKKKCTDCWALHYPEPSAAWLSPAIAQLGHLIGPLPCTQARKENRVVDGSVRNSIMIGGDMQPFS